MFQRQHRSRAGAHARGQAHGAQLRARYDKHPEVAAVHERARVVSSLLAASRALPADPDAAALLLDGALAQLLDLWARGAHIALGDRRQALSALEERAPAVAWRVRLALQAHDPVARLAHCWALLELLTGPTSLRQRSTPAALIAPHLNANCNANSRVEHRDVPCNAAGTNGDSHVG